MGQIKNYPYRRELYFKVCQKRASNNEPQHPINAFHILQLKLLHKAGSGLGDATTNMEIYIYN